MGFVGFFVVLWGVYVFGVLVGNGCICFLSSKIGVVGWLMYFEWSLVMNDLWWICLKIE